MHWNCPSTIARLVNASNWGKADLGQGVWREIRYDAAAIWAIRQRAQRLE